MPDKHLFEYAVLRLVPRVEREEFINIGVILYCRSQDFLQTCYGVPEGRIRALAGIDFDLHEIIFRLQAFERICGGRKEGGTIGQLGLAERFRWLTATRSTMVQTSPVHPGLCEDPAATLVRLYERLVQ